MPRINVAVRVRPLTEREARRGAFECLEVEEDESTINCVDPDDKVVEGHHGKAKDYLHARTRRGWS